MGNAKTLEDLLNVKTGIGLCWLGNMGWLIRAGTQLFAIDLDIDHASEDRRDERLQPSPISSADLAPRLDIMFATHEHGDHFSAVTAAVLARQSSCMFVIPANCADKAHRAGIPQSRIRVTRPGDRFELPGVVVEPPRAQHGRGAATPDDCGYVLTLGSMRLYQPGDTVLLDEHLALKDIDVLFVSPTVHTLTVDGSVRLAQARYREASPFWRVQPAPAHFLIVHGTADTGEQRGQVPIGISRRFCARLRRAGVDATLVSLKGAPHGFTGAPASVHAKRAWKVIVPFVRKRLVRGR